MSFAISVYLAELLFFPQKRIKMTAFKLDAMQVLDTVRINICFWRRLPQETHKPHRSGEKFGIMAFTAV
jgi:hypothetical protein